MSEVFSILVALGALIVGLLGIGWACGDFWSRSETSPPSSQQKSQSAAS